MTEFALGSSSSLPLESSVRRVSPRGSVTATTGVGRLVGSWMARTDEIPQLARKRPADGDPDGAQPLTKRFGYLHIGNDSSVVRPPGPTNSTRSESSGEKE